MDKCGGVDCRLVWAPSTLLSVYRCVQLDLIKGCPQCMKGELLGRAWLSLSREKALVMFVADVTYPEGWALCRACSSRLWLDRSNWSVMGGTVGNNEVNGKVEVQSCGLDKNIVNPCTIFHHVIQVGGPASGGFTFLR